MRSATPTSRRGSTLLEVQVAVTMFGLALAGIGPLGIMYLKQVTALESRLSEETVYYLSPSSDRWVRKLGASAALSIVEPEILAELPATTINNVSLLEVTIPTAGEAVSALVEVVPQGEGGSP